MYYSNGDSKHHDKEDLIPQFDGYQLIGDSQFLRFSEQLLGLNREKSNGLAYLGLCVSGQKISDLLGRVDNDFYPTSKQAVLMIGTNDLLQGTPVEQMRNNMESLICKLIERGVNTLIVLTVPPVPRLANSSDHWSRLNEFNKHIKSLENDQDIFVVDAYSKFVEKKQLARRGSFPYRDKSLNRSPSRNSLSIRESRSSLNESLDRWPKKESRDGSPDRRSRGNSRRSSPNESFDRWPKREPKGSPNESPEHHRYVKRESRDDRNSYLKREDGSPGDPPKSLFSSISTPTPSERLPTRGALRISVSTDLGVRDVYVTEDNRESREASFESCQSYSTSSSGSVKRPRPTYASNDSPPPKRRSFHSFVEDDHNDRFCEDDGATRTSDIADEINLSLFEEYFSRSSGRKDLIHLNYNGLRIIRNLISGAIRRINGD